MRSFFMSRQRRKVQDSLSCVQWRANESHGPSPSGWCEQWESAVSMMMIEGDESLQLSTVEEHEVCRMENFPVM